MPRNAAAFTGSSFRAAALGPWQDVDLIDVGLSNAYAGVADEALPGPMLDLLRQIDAAEQAQADRQDDER